MSNYLLTLLILLPFAGALALVGHSFTSYRRDSHYRWIALGVSLINFLVSLLLLTGGDTGSSAFRFEQNVEWISSIRANYHLGVDGISLWLVLLITFLMPIAIASSWHAVEKRVVAFYVFLLLLESVMIGVFVSLDLLLFYLFFEASLVPMFFLIGIWGGERRIYAATKFFIYTAVGSLLMLAGIIGLYYYCGTFDYVEILNQMRTGAVVLGARTELLLFFAFALAFAIKVPLFPFHTWLPDAHTEAPTAGSIILAGVLLKMGTYGLMRFNMGLFPSASSDVAPYMIILAIIGIIYGALVAMVQPDVKRLVAYSSVSHMGFVILGMFSLTDAGMQGALYQMLNHGVSTGALFLIVGVIYERRHTRLISEFGGLSHVMPWFAAFFVISSLSSIGLPFLNGFVGEFLIMLGMWLSGFDFGRVATMIAATGVIWAAIYMLWMLQRVLFGRLTNEKNYNLHDLNAREFAIILPLVALMLIMGVYPQPFLSRTFASVETIRARVSAAHGGGGSLVAVPPPAKAQSAAVGASFQK